MEALWIFPAVGALLAAVGMFFATSGVRGSRRYRRFVRTAQQTTAEVIDVRLKHDRNTHGDAGHNTSYWVPVVRFALPDGRWVESETMYGAAPAPARRGETVTVRFDLEDPTRVNLASGLAQGSTVGCLQLGLGIGLALMGLAVLAIGVLVLVIAS